MGTMKNLKYILIIYVTITLLSSCTKKNTDTKTDNEKYCIDEVFYNKIQLDTAKLEKVKHGIPLMGIVEPNPEKVVHFVSLVSGIVSKTHFSLGDVVSKGQVLAEIISTELSTLQSELKISESKISVAQRHLKSVEQMYNDGIASEIDLLEAKSELNINYAELEKIKNDLSLFSAVNNNTFHIKAPNSGIITAKNISSGMPIIAESEPLFSVSDLSEVWVLLNIYAGNVANIETGLCVEIKTLSYPNEVFTGKITAISQIFDKEERVLKARVVMKNDNYKLKPGMFVDVVVKKEKNIEAIAIPTKSLIFDADVNNVVVYKDNCNLIIKQVEIITQSNGVAYVSKGLNNNEVVISENQLLIYEQIKNLSKF